MLTQIAYFPLFGLPLIVWGGLTTAILLVLTLVAGLRSVLKKPKDPKCEKRFLVLLIITTIMGLGHGFLGLIINIFQNI